MKSQILLSLFMAGVATAFAPSPALRIAPSPAAAATTTSNTALSAMTAAAAAIPNPFKKLPWVAEKERQREARRIKSEAAKLHRQLGIVEDATYEEIVQATDNLIAAAGNDIKAKIQIEVAKDKILQIRLNERMAGLSNTLKDAKAQSSFEKEGAADVDDAPKEGKEWKTPEWTKGLIKKPDAEYRMQQAKLWGIITLIGAAFPPAQDYMNRFTWLVCVAQLRFRGMPKEMREGGGLGVSFGGRGPAHGKVAWALGVSIWLGGAALVYGLMPAWAKGYRWSGTLGFAIQNLVFAVGCSYLQPYKA